MVRIYIVDVSRTLDRCYIPELTNIILSYMEATPKEVNSDIKKMIKFIENERDNRRPCSTTFRNCFLKSIHKMILNFKDDLGRVNFL
jgi:hypothetical protein